MSNERFDKLMKSQLESVNPTYQAHAWDRFQKRLPAVGFWPWLGNYGGWVLSCFMLMGWLTTLYMVRENQLLLAQLNGATRKQVAAPQSSQPSVALRTEAARSRRIDTVYIVKRTIVEHRFSNPPANQLLTDTDLLVQSDSAIGSLAGANGRLTKTASGKTRIKRSRPPYLSTNTDSSGRTQLTEGDQSTTKTTQLKKTKSTQLLTDDSTDVGIRTNQALGEQAIAADNLQTPSNAPEQRTTKSDSITQKNAPSAAPEQNQSAKRSRPAFRLSALKPRVGLELAAIQNGIGIGPGVELFLSENLGLSMGLQAAQLHSQTHRDMDDFNAKTGKDFVRQYQSFLPARYDRIDDISIHTSVISLPVTFKYYVSLKRNWSLLFQTGTSFDLAAYQQIHYDSEFQGTERYNSFEVNSQRSFFHNFIFGAGIQYHKSRIAGQLIPYYSYDFRSMANIPSGSNFGLKASIWLDLVK